MHPTQAQLRQAGVLSLAARASLQSFAPKTLVGTLNGYEHPLVR